MHNDKFYSSSSPSPSSASPFSVDIVISRQAEEEKEITNSTQELNTLAVEVDEDEGASR